ncbi:MAG: maleylacetoacetate isomerase [Gammaproteobacteria bacterium]|nr:maleylacetoacetate isomerase [Gammaproteobacteria bacterium]
MKLYSYWRSSAAYRVRIALNLKQIEHEIVPVHLVRDGGEQFAEPYRTLNPAQLVPTLVDGDLRLGQSLAIIDYLDQRQPEPALLPADPLRRAHALQGALTVACEIHPLNNLRVLNHLGTQFGADKAQKKDWYAHWILTSFGALEILADEYAGAGPYFLGEAVSIADVCLVPQIYNARRFKVDLDRFPRLVEIDAACGELEAFGAAAPEAQPDAD